jgi:hypothetical protein
MDFYAHIDPFEEKNFRPNLGTVSLFGPQKLISA